MPAATPTALTARPFRRELTDGFGSEAYAREELRAEISAMMTGDRLGTGHDPSRGAAYVSSWVKVLDKNPQEIVNASAEAQRISNYLISRTRERQQDQGDKTRDQGDKTRDQGDKTRDQGDKTRDQGGKTKEPGEKTQEPGEKTQEAAIPKENLTKRWPVRPVPSDGLRGPGTAARLAPVERHKGRDYPKEQSNPNRGEAVVRGAGRPGVRQQQLPGRGAPER